MRVSALTNNEAAFNGFTHRIELTKNDLTTSTVTTAQTITLLTLAAGHLIEKVAYALKTAFANSGDATTDSTLITIGDSTAVNTFRTSTEVNVNGTEIVYAAGTNTAGKAYNAADTLKIVFTPKSGTALNTLDTGEIHVFVKLVDLSKASQATI